MNSYFYPQKPCGLPIKEALKRCPTLRNYTIKGKNSIDLGNSEALLLYNRLVLQDFMSLDFSVPSGYLIPTVCSRWMFLSWIINENTQKRIILEIGTGASAILTMMLAKIGCNVKATEYDEIALQSARRNIRMNNLEPLISLIKVEKDCILDKYYDSLTKFDAIICNPPQYDQNFFHQQNLNKGFVGQEFELVGGKIGHEFTIRLIEEVKNFHNPPSVYFQLTNTKLLRKICDHLQDRGYSFLKDQRKVGTRQRYYFRVD
ncbi:MAG: RlmF-related methyltransferase [Promethearchaeota archaeon]